MNPNVPVGVIYALFTLFAVLAAVFLKGKAVSLFVGHNTAREPVFSAQKLCRAFGVCLWAVAAVLLISALLRNNCPEWFRYVFYAVIGGAVLVGTVICFLNVIVKE
ncbi:MAG: DUF3784 domain-containing protein [Oscillospiraceae bacterium]